VTLPADGWHVATSAPPIGAGDVHVWRAPLDLDGPALERLGGVLSLDELARAERYAFAYLRRRLVARQGWLRCILGTYLGLPPQRVRFEIAQGGKPRLGAELGTSGLRFSASHSGELALVGIAAGRELGVDVEEVRPLPGLNQLADRWLAPGELAALRGSPEPARLRAFYQCWTLKEAYLKARGEGLRLPLADFDTSQEGTIVEAGDRSRWSSATLRPGDEYAGAVVVEGGYWTLTSWECGESFLLRSADEDGQPLEPAWDERRAPPRLLVHEANARKRREECLDRALPERTRDSATEAEVRAAAECEVRVR
jgi:4'-phosphopantetheinyl transferase